MSLGFLVKEVKSRCVVFSFLGVIPLLIPQNGVPG